MPIPISCLIDPLFDVSAQKTGAVDPKTGQRQGESISAASLAASNFSVPSNGLRGSTVDNVFRNATPYSMTSGLPQFSASKNVMLSKSVLEPSIYSDVSLTATEKSSNEIPESEWQGTSGMSGTTLASTDESGSANSPTSEPASDSQISLSLSTSNAMISSYLASPSGGRQTLTSVSSTEASRRPAHGSPGPSTRSPSSDSRPRDTVTIHTTITPAPTIAPSGYRIDPTGSEASSDGSLLGGMLYSLSVGAPFLNNSPFEIASSVLHYDAPPGAYKRTV